MRCGMWAGFLKDEVWYVISASASCRFVGSMLCFTITAAIWLSFVLCAPFVAGVLWDKVAEAEWRLDDIEMVFILFEVPSGGRSYAVIFHADFAPDVDGAMLPGYLFPLCINRELLLTNWCWRCWVFELHGAAGVGFSCLLIIAATFLEYDGSKAEDRQMLVSTQWARIFLCPYWLGDFLHTSSYSTHVIQDALSSLAGVFCKCPWWQLHALALLYLNLAMVQIHGFFVLYDVPDAWQHFILHTSIQKYLLTKKSGRDKQRVRLHYHISPLKVVGSSDRIHVLADLSPQICCPRCSMDCRWLSMQMSLVAIGFKASSSIRAGFLDSGVNRF
ncbi:hypothetical protein Nepgr_018743 [Nepenthes gracilis]|uniref:Uncharacterized protein n=1 Tax=Nepenthes gracilis TaxID=150966 RepID=A0AAD3XTD7_NEPGR|nr:hypothetical protein Nepgr_018743 [Nepenthes gracilis]